MVVCASVVEFSVNGAVVAAIPLVAVVDNSVVGGSIGISTKKT